MSSSQDKPAIKEKKTSDAAPKAEQLGSTANTEETSTVRRPLIFCTGIEAIPMPHYHFRHQKKKKPHLERAPIKLKTNFGEAVFSLRNGYYIGYYHTTLL
jgi:hypothetical protein